MAGNKILNEYGESVFTSISRLAREHDAVDLGQGVPGMLPPGGLRDSLADLSETVENHQYSLSKGNQSLRCELSEFYEDLYDLRYDPEREITITTGATEALHAAIMGLTNPGSEVIVFEPIYDQYVPVARRAGAKINVLSLKRDDYKLPRKQLRQEVSDRTDLIILNNPHNPTGRIYAREQLEELVELARRHDVHLLSDEVYEHLYFDRDRFDPLPAIPGARERTLRFGSAGKSFNATGWKVGWALGPPSLTEPLRLSHQFSTYCAATPIQVALANFLSGLDHVSFYESLRQSYSKRREVLLEGFAGTPFELSRNDGTYFTVGEYTRGSDRNDEELVRWMIKEVGVAAIPLSAFYNQDDEDNPKVRFAFCKSIDHIERAVRRVKDFFD